MWKNILKVKTCAHMVLSALCKKYITFVYKSWRIGIKLRL